MEVIVFTTPNKFNTEVETVVELFERGLGTLHLRKPKFSRRRMKQYIRGIPQQYHSRIVIHHHHRLALHYGLRGIHIGRKERNKRVMVWLKRFFFRLRKRELMVTTSFHSLQSLVDNDQHYDYVFLSPVFDSLSKKGHVAAFNHNQLTLVLAHTRFSVVALGGIDAGKIEQVREMGFNGVALLGMLWEAPQEEHIAIFEAVRDQANGTDPAPDAR
ncbi:MAG: thiamine phosphate synthase [Bacteroidota bacterium]